MEYKQVVEWINKQKYNLASDKYSSWHNFVDDFNFCANTPWIQISGTNGKSSVLNYIYEIYKASSYKVATFSYCDFTSPLDSIKINGKPIKETTFTRIFEKYSESVTKYNLTLAELMSCIAYEYFDKEEPDLILIESFEGVNELTKHILGNPTLVVLTNVSVDYSRYKNNSLKEITKNMVEEIPADSKCIVGRLDKDLEKKILKSLKHKKVKLFSVSELFNAKYNRPYFNFSYGPYENLSILSPADFLVNNACLAIETVTLLQGEFPVNEYQIRKGLLSKPLICRFERIQNIILDGAQNTEALKSLIGNLENSRKGKDVHVLYATFKNNNTIAHISLLKKISNDIILTTFSSHDSKKESDYYNFDGKFNFNDDFRLALSNLIAQYPKDIIVVTGSVNFVYQVRTYLCKILHYDE